MYPAPELNATKGKVYLYNFTANSAWELTINGKRLNKNLFNPHGMTSWTTAKGSQYCLLYIYANCSTFRQNPYDLHHQPSSQRRSNRNIRPRHKAKSSQSHTHNSLQILLQVHHLHLVNHMYSILFSFIHSLNNIVAIGQDKLFGINFHYFNKTWLRNAEILLKLSMGSIFFYNGSSARLVDRWTLSPNGIAWDKSKR